MAAVRKILGKLKCLCCGEQVAAKEQNGSGLAVASCPYCGFMEQAHGELGDKFIRGRITPLATSEAANSAGEVVRSVREKGSPPRQAPRAGAQESSSTSSSKAAEKPAEEKTIFDYFTTKGASK